MSKIHFASLFGVDYDSDLILHWADHYLKHNLDSYTVWLHSARNDYTLLEACASLFNRKGFRVFVVNQPGNNAPVFKNGGLRTEYLSKFQCSLPYDDYLVVADSDEFQDVSNYQWLFSDHEIIVGGLIDRYDTSLHDAQSDVSIEAQFPFEGSVETALLTAMPMRERSYFPRTDRRKVLGCRADIPVEFSGSHRVMEVPAGARVAGDSISPYRDSTDDFNYKVRHYCWRRSIFERMYGKTYYNSLHMNLVRDFFKEPSESIWIEKKRVLDESEQTLKGWEPCQSPVTA